LVLEGSLYQLWNLNKDQKILLSKIAKVQADTLKIQSKIKRVSDPRFLELEVRDQLDYANNGDLIFVFSDKQ
jgi:cell division protein FtsB